MSTDLENDLRDALHARAATITPDRLRRSAAPHRSVRRPIGAWVDRLADPDPVLADQYSGQRQTALSWD